MSLEEAQAALKQLEARLATATSERSRLEEQITNREKKRKELPQLISDAKAKLELLTKTPPAENPNDALVEEAAGWASQAVRLMLEESLAALESEQQAYEAEASLLPLQLTLAQADQKRLQEQLSVANEELSRIRQDRILSKRSQVLDLVKGLPPDLQERGQDLLDRIEEWLALSAKQVAVKQEIESSKAVLERWKSQRAKMDSRVNPQPGSKDVSGFNSWVGLMLRKQRTELPNESALDASLAHYRGEMQQADSLLFDLDDALFEIQSQQEAFEKRRGNSQGFLDSLQRNYQNDDDASAGDSLSDDPQGSALASNPQLETTATLLAEAGDILEGMRLDVDAYLFDLYQVADVKQQTRVLAAEYRSLIDEHILWIRSADELQRSDGKPAYEAFRWLVDYGNWSGLATQLFSDMRLRPWWYFVFLVGMLALLANQARMRRVIGQLGGRAEKKGCTDFSLTARAVLLTLLISLPLTILLLFVHWRIEVVKENALFIEGTADFLKSIGHGLRTAAVVLFPLELLRQVCRLDGLGIKHFGWDKTTTRGLASSIRWLIDLSIPLAFVVAVLASHADLRWESSLGRVAFILLMPLLSIFCARVLSPTRGVLSPYLKQYPGGWLDRLRDVWFAVLVTTPAILVVISFVGYHYTAMRIAGHLSQSMWVVVFLTLIYFVFKRWVVLNRRKLMNAQARQRLEEAAKREAGREPLTGVSPLPVADQREMDLVTINDQTQRLLTSFIVTVGIVLGYLVWSDILPAVTFLDGFTLWSVQGNLPDQTIRITLANLLLVIPIIILLFVAGRNVPGLLEIAFLQHLPLTGAARYAITTLTRYAIVGTGLVVVSSTLGLKWSSIQWLVAALGVGLGFGLQEIFANFVSGVVLLFEQPIRVGDIITVDGTTGSVLKIRMRATTIVNWDRQELIVPNKDLITGKLLNWTLSDSTNRIVINVGIAYGSEPATACELVYKACSEHPNILRDPPTKVTFEGFGDNSLNIVARAFLGSLEHRLDTIHELHQAIYHAFSQAGIEISFPQRDLHIRSLPAPFSDWLDRKR